MEELDWRGGRGGRKSRSVGTGRYREGGGENCEGGPKGGGEYEGDPDEEWKKRARGKRGRAVKAGGVGGGGRTRRARRV